MRSAGSTGESVCQLLVQTMGYHSAWIAVLSPEGALVTVAQSGSGDSFTSLAQQLRDGVLPPCALAALSAMTCAW
jgi:hypothetical protein